MKIYSEPVAVGTSDKVDMWTLCPSDGNGLQREQKNSRTLFTGCFYKFFKTILKIN